MENLDSMLVGWWQSTSAGDANFMEFRADGTRNYCVELADRWQIMKLVFRIEADEIVTDQPSAPREERTRFDFEGTTLYLLNEGERVVYRRCPPPSSLPATEVGDCGV